MTTVLLGALAVSLAGPTPAVTARTGRLRRTPRAAMLWWQGMALAAVLAALGAGLSLVTDNAWRQDLRLPGLALAGVALALTCVVVGRLLLSGHRVGTSLRVSRRRLRDRLDLFARPHGGVQVLEHDVPVAYCLPGLRGARVVVSAGALGQLEADEVTAVIAHERAHLRARHDLVLEAFSVLRRAFPRWVSSDAALSEVRLLVEVLADRAAARTVGAKPVVRALVALAHGPTPPEALGAGGEGLAERARLLGDPRRYPVQATLVTGAALAVLVLPTAFVALPWLLSLR